MNTLTAARQIEQDRRISEAFAREATRLGQFIRGRVSDAGVAEDILQDVFSELIEAERLVQPIEQVGAWLFRVARNRITDWFRRKKPETRAPIEASKTEIFPGKTRFPRRMRSRCRVPARADASGIG